MKQVPVAEGFSFNQPWNGYVKLIRSNAGTPNFVAQILCSSTLITVYQFTSNNKSSGYL